MPIMAFKKMQTPLFYIYILMPGKFLREIGHLNNSMHIQAVLLLSLVLRGLSHNKDRLKRAEINADILQDIDLTAEKTSQEENWPAATAIVATNGAREEIS